MAVGVFEFDFFPRLKASHNVSKKAIERSKIASVLLILVLVGLFDLQKQEDIARSSFSLCPESLISSLHMSPHLTQSEREKERGKLVRTV